MHEECGGGGGLAVGLSCMRRPRNKNNLKIN